jgi:hypothetical protein
LGICLSIYCNHSIRNYLYIGNLGALDQQEALRSFLDLRNLQNTTPLKLLGEVCECYESLVEPLRHKLQEPRTMVREIGKTLREVAAMWVPNQATSSTQAQVHVLNLK